MQRRRFMASSLAAAGAALSGCATPGSGWLTLVDGATMSSFDGFAPVGAGNWIQ